MTRGPSCQRLPQQKWGVWDSSVPNPPCFLLSAFHFPIFGHPFILIFLCVDGGERDISVEANGNKCGGGREKNGKEHGQHAGNLHRLPHRDTVDNSALCCVTPRPRINAPVILYYHSCFQASWKCLGGGHPCRARHLVETLQWVWAAQNIPPGHLPLHHRPSTTGEKGKERTYGRGNHSGISIAGVLVGWHDWNPFATICFCRCIIVVAPLAGRVCVAQTVCRQPRPRLCWAAESRPGKLLTARCVTPCPLQW